MKVLISTCTYHDCVAKKVEILLQAVDYNRTNEDMMLQRRARNGGNEVVWAHAVKALGYTHFITDNTYGTEELEKLGVAILVVTGNDRLEQAYGGRPGDDHDALIEGVVIEQTQQLKDFLDLG